jgi:hypothetical protein
MPTKKKKQKLAPCIASEAPVHPPAREPDKWPRLFNLRQFLGHWIAELAPELHNHQQYLLDKSHLHGEENPRRKRVSQSASLFSLIHKPTLHDAIGLTELFHWVKAAKSKAESRTRANDAKEYLCNAVDCITGLTHEQAPPHKRKTTVKIEDIRRPVPVAYVAIEHALNLVQTHHRLPTKAEVRHSLIDAHPEELGNKGAASSFWSDLWKEAKLKGLPEATTW